MGEGEEQLSTSLALVLAEEEEEQEKEETHAEPARLNLSAPYDVAKVFVIRNNGFIGKIEGELVREPTLWFWQREFWAWNGCCYQMVEEDEVRAKVYDFLDRSVELDGRALKPKPRNVSEVIDGLKAGANIKIAEAPTWLGVEGLPEAKGFLVCRNGLVEFETGKLRKHDPRFFGINSVDFDFDPTARAPRFEKFLKEVWPNDEETVATLQEFFGLWLTDVTKYQKACVLIGPPRSGKGTIGGL